MTLVTSLTDYETVKLDELERVSFLSRRTDKKFIFNSALLPELLTNLQGSCRALCIDGTCVFPYRTIYFDTPDLLLYRLHHNGKTNRFKIRSRHYVASGAVYNEIKHKTNKGRTVKFRIRRDALRYEIDDTFKSFIDRSLPQPIEGLYFSLDVAFSRITLVDKRFSERVTIDTGLTYTFNDRCCSFPGLTIVEIKHERHSGESIAERLLRQNGLRRTRCSKYCLGIVSLRQGVKTNRFKPMLREIEKCTQQTVPVEP